MIEWVCAKVEDELPRYVENTFDACFCDPPYGLQFMGKSWDHGVPSAEVWRETLRVLKPGAFLLSFGGTRTWHRLACAIEDAGFELRDTLMYLYGSGFPKGHDYAFALHKKAEQEAEHDLRFVLTSYLSKTIYACRECGQVLLTHLSEPGAPESWKAWSKSKLAGTSQPSVEGWSHLETPERELLRCEICSMSHGILADGSEGRLYHGASTSHGETSRQAAFGGGSGPPQGPRPVKQSNRQPDVVQIERRAQASRGWNVALKPAWEPILVAMKPCEGTFAENALEWGVAGLAIDAGRIEAPSGITSGGAQGHMPQPMDWGSPSRIVRSEPHPLGRWPANLILDEEAGAVLDEQSGILTSGKMRAGTKRGNQSGWSGPMPERTGSETIGDSGGASRFFYCAKASRSERGEGNNHPTVKPLALCEYLARLILPPERDMPRVVLVPFSGSGSEALACDRAGWDLVMAIEQDPSWVEVAKRREAEWRAQRK